MMTWTNILVPALGEESDARRLEVARALAEPFAATLTVAYVPMPSSSLFNWAIEAGAGPTEAAIATLQHNTDAGYERCLEMFAALDYSRKALETVDGGGWVKLRNAARLADVVVWHRAVAHGHDAFASAFQQILLDERRPALLADRPFRLGGTVAVAWDGGAEASRAIRRALPLLRKADQVVLLTAPHAMAGLCDGSRALSYLADHGIKAIPEALHAYGEAGPMILAAVRGVGARLLVAGAFGHPRLQRFIFGGTTRVLLEGCTSAAQFLSH